MLSHRRSAQLGLFFGSLVLILSLAVLVAGAKDSYFQKGQPGQPAAQFTLHSIDNEKISLSSFRDSIVVLYFSSARCPINNDYNDRLAEFSSKYANDSRVKIVAINSNVIPDEMVDAFEIRVHSKVCGLNFPTLLDDGGSIAEAYAAEVTPTFFVIDGSGMIRYRGAFDDNRNAAQVNLHYCEDAVAALLAEKPVEHTTSPVFGCRIQ